MGSAVLVTGGAGFIGSHLVRALLGRGYGVRVLDNLSTGSLGHLEGVLRDVDFRQGDLREPAHCARACDGMDAVFHLGALGSVPRSLDDPLTTHAANATGTLNLLLAARKAAVGRVIFSSSSSVYGNTPSLPKHEGLRVSPESPYAASKAAGEEYCRSFWRSFGVETVILRYFNVFGPRQDPSSQYAAVIPLFARALLEGRRPVIYGDGRQSRDFTHVANVVHGNLLAAQAQGVGGECFNIACGDQIPLADVLQQIARTLELKADPEFLPARTGDVRHSRADISAAKQRLGYEPTVPFADGLADAVRYYVRQGARPRPAAALAGTAR